MKKIIAALMTITLLVSFAACACSHEWTEATFWEPKTCTKCGETEGEKLQADFEQHGYTCDMKIGETVDQRTMCYDDATKTTVLKCKVLSVERFTPASNMFEGSGIDAAAPEGYAWVHVKTEQKACDDMAWNYGFHIGLSYDDYYDVKSHDDFVEYIGSVDCAGLDGPVDATRFVLNYKGQTYDACYRLIESHVTGWLEDHTYTTTKDFYFLLPDGYDGMVLGVYDRSLRPNGWTEGTYLFDNVPKESAHFFRVENW